MRFTRVALARPALPRFIKSVSHIVVKRFKHAQSLLDLSLRRKSPVHSEARTPVYASSQFDPFAGFTFEDILWRNGFTFLEQNNTLIACMTVKVEVRLGPRGEMDDWQTITRLTTTVELRGPAPFSDRRPLPATWPTRARRWRCALACNCESATPVELRTLTAKREFLLYTPMSSCCFRWDDERLKSTVKSTNVQNPPCLGWIL